MPALHQVVQRRPESRLPLRLAPRVLRIPHVMQRRSQQGRLAPRGIQGLGLGKPRRHAHHPQDVMQVVAGINVGSGGDLGVHEGERRLDGRRVVGRDDLGRGGAAGGSRGWHFGEAGPDKWVMMMVVVMVVVVVVSTRVCGLGGWRCDDVETTHAHMYECVHQRCVGEFRPCVPLPLSMVVEGFGGHPQPQPIDTGVSPPGCAIRIRAWLEARLQMVLGLAREPSNICSTDMIRVICLGH